MRLTNFAGPVAPDMVRRQSGRNKGVYFDQLKLPEGSDSPKPVIFTGGEYNFLGTGQKAPYFVVKVHERVIKHGQRQVFYTSEICSAGFDPANLQPCVGCSATQSGEAVEEKLNYYYGIIHLGWYHTFPLIDVETGEPRLRQDGAPMLAYEECLGSETCNVCRLLSGRPLMEAKNVERVRAVHPQAWGLVFARPRYLKVGPGHKRNVDQVNDLLRRTCVNCREEMPTHSYSCGGNGTQQFPGCGRVLIDRNTTTLDLKKVEEAIDKRQPFPCQNCASQVMLLRDVSCPTCQAAGVTPTQIGVGDVVAYLKKEGQAQTSTVQLKGWELFPEFQERYVQALNGETIEQLLARMGVYDFPTKLVPNSLEDQEKNLFPPAHPRRKSQPMNFRPLQQVTPGVPPLAHPPTRPLPPPRPMGG